MGLTCKFFQYYLKKARGHLDEPGSGVYYIGMSFSISLPVSLECEDCPLHESPDCTQPVPMSVHSEPTGKSRAILVVGEAPGEKEDEAVQNFVGQTGEVLQRLYIHPKTRRDRLWDFRQYGDIFYANAARCRPYQNETPTNSQIKKCRPNLKEDLLLLKSKYESVAILCVGAAACRSVLDCGLKVALQMQGTLNQQLTMHQDVPVFSTYHPGVLLIRRDPALAGTICDHLSLFWEFLRGQRSVTAARSKSPPRAPEPPSTMPSILALDIETYGAVETQPPQHYFHPKKCETLDNIDRTEIIRTVGLAWRQGNSTETGIFVMSVESDRNTLYRWLAEAKKSGTSILGMNLKFDISMLRHCYPWLIRRGWLTHSTPLLDISVLNYLQNELRPERSLKAISQLFGLDPYEKTLKSHRFKDDMDPDLWVYNVKDCVVSLEALDVLQSRIRQDYGSNSAKLSDYSLKWYSDLLWTSIYMSESGVHLNVDYLEKLHLGVIRKIAQSKAAYMDRYEEPLSGKGSQKAVQELINHAVDLTDLLAHPLLEKTKKTKRISTKQGNMSLILDHLRDKSLRRKFKDLIRYRKLLKLSSSYLYPLIVGRGKDNLDRSSVLLQGIAYPDWYPVPSAQKDGAGGDGGTIQCRITCKKPALQTAPKPVKKALFTRFDPGFLCVTDLSQIELRVAGLLSQDPEFMKAYQGDVDIHTTTTLALFGTEIQNDPYFRKYRQAGKTINFLMLYKGGAGQLQHTLAAEFDLVITIRRAAEMIEAFYDKYHVFGKWQDELIEGAISNGYVEVPLVGASRQFTGSPHVIRRTYANEICNLPVQALAANILISAQGTVFREILHKRLSSVTGLQIYDSLFVEGPLSELGTIKRMVRKTVINPPFFQDLCTHLGRTIPVKADEDIYIRRGNTLEKQ